MLSKTLLKKLSAYLAAAMLLSCCPCFAEPVADTMPLTEQEGEQGDGQLPEDDGQTEPLSVDVNIGANYFQDENDQNVYKIIFSSLDNLDDYKAFSFKVTVPESQRESITLTEGSFADALKSGSFSVSNTGTYQFNFSNGSETTLQGGKLTLATVTYNGEAVPSAETIVFDTFTAVNANDEAVTFNPTVTYEAGPVVPELSEDEQAVYDIIIALPDADTISFYDDNSDLISLDELKTTVTEAVDAYKALTAEQKANVDAVLLYNEESKDNLTTLPAVITAMEAAYPILVMDKTLPAADSDDIEKYYFMTNVYSDVISGINAVSLPAQSTLSTQFTAAKANILLKKNAIEATVSGLNDYLTKIDFIGMQLPVIQTLSSDKYYNEYLDDLMTQTIILEGDIKENYQGSSRDTLLETLSGKKTAIQTIIDGVDELPTFTVGSVSLRANYKVTVKRPSSGAIDAQIKVLVYNKSGTKIDEDTFDYKAGEAQLECSLSASVKTYPTNEKIKISVYYIVSGAEFNLGSTEVECRAVYISTEGIQGGGYGNGGGNTTNKNDNKDKDKNTTGGTRYPSGNPDDYDDDEDTKDDEPLFGDIDNYGWAKEAIEGLYYAGIINGMEEGVFNPSGDVTREQFCKMVVQLFDVLGYETETSFVDVNPDAWYAPYISSAIRAGYVQGQSDEYFGIGESIMRQDMATILFRALGSMGSTAVLDFTDNENIAPYAEDAISELVGLGVLNGYEDGSFKPRGTATRAEAAKVIWEVYKILYD